MVVYVPIEDVRCIVRQVQIEELPFLLHREMHVREFTYEKPLAQESPAAELTNP
jgi:hypothetical protein